MRRVITTEEYVQMSTKISKDTEHNNNKQLHKINILFKKYTSYHISLLCK